MYFCVSRLPGFSAIRISPSEFEMVALLAEGEVDAAVGQADVVEDQLDLVGGMTCRISFSTAAKYCSESSRRMPWGGFTCRRIWPEST